MIYSRAHKVIVIRTVYHAFLQDLVKDLPILPGAISIFVCMYEQGGLVPVCLPAQQTFSLVVLILVRAGSMSMPRAASSGKQLFRNNLSPSHITTP